MLSVGLNGRVAGFFGFAGVGGVCDDCRGAAFYSTDEAAGGGVGVAEEEADDGVAFGGGGDDGDDCQCGYLVRVGVGG